jgi:hypothetical protein
MHIMGDDPPIHVPSKHFRTFSYCCAVGTFGRKETTRSLGMMELLYVELCQHANPKQACGKLGCQRKIERLWMLGAPF